MTLSLPKSWRISPLSPKKIEEFRVGARHCLALLEGDPSGHPCIFLRFSKTYSNLGKDQVMTHPTPLLLDGPLVADTGASFG